MMLPKDAAEAAVFEQQIGGRMRARRRQLGLSQSELAGKLGVSFQQVQKYERGANRMAASTLVLAAAALGVSVGWLVAEDMPQSGEKDLLSALSRPGALEILQAFNAISDNRGRNALLAIAEALARPGHLPNADV
jgi:transcriptional regulator with XRE-family HTH domain